MIPLLLSCVSDSNNIDFKDLSGKSLFFGPGGCNDCHVAGTAGAPVLSDSKNWQRRLEQRRQYDIFINTMRGYGLMEPKGGCFDCDSLDIKKIIDYMFSEIREK